MRRIPDDHIEDSRIGTMMKEFGFNPESSTSTARALILNLVRSAYGNEAAREFMRQMNLEKNRDVEPSIVMNEFKKEQERVNKELVVAREIPGVGTEETQLSFFDVNKVPGTYLAQVFFDATFLQKKSRRA